ncbi:MAG: hypothetical protein AABX30_02135 [Nanoarchaeota archaeon]
MENKNVGWLIIGIAVVLLVIVIMFNSVLKSAIGATCTHGPSCGMYKNLNIQTWLSIAVVGIIFMIGIVLIFSKPKEKLVEKTIIKTKIIKEKKKQLDLSGLDSKEKEVVKLLQEENAVIFQATLMEKLGIGKVGITRLLDKLEAKQIIERKRRGMNNIVVLKNY